MDNRYIDSQARFFKFYLQECLSYEMREILNAISRKTEVYVFSGIIRNFFLGESSFRDLDIVVGDVECVIDTINAVDSEVEFRVNSFGGVKVKIQNLIIDLWGLENTWGIRKEKMELTPQSLLKTAFFNFSGIVFDYNKSQFYYDDAFVHFLENRMMDVVYTKNPNIPLCIINSCYYRENYGFGLSRRLCYWIFINHTFLASDKKCEEIFNDVQRHHFAKVVISYEQIREFVFLCYRHYKIHVPILPRFI